MFKVLCYSSSIAKEDTALRRQILSPGRNVYFTNTGRRMMCNSPWIPEDKTQWPVTKRSTIPYN
jgi:hypothetical protein